MAKAPGPVFPSLNLNISWHILTYLERIELIRCILPLSRSSARLRFNGLFWNEFPGISDPLELQPYLSHTLSNIPNKERVIALDLSFSSDI